MRSTTEEIMGENEKLRQECSGLRAALARVVAGGPHSTNPPKGCLCRWCEARRLLPSRSPETEPYVGPCCVWERRPDGSDAADPAPVRQGHGTGEELPAAVDAAIREYRKCVGWDSAEDGARAALESAIRAALRASRERRGEELRPEVAAFARAMEAKLRKHDKSRGAGGWKNDDPSRLLARLDEESEELGLAVSPLSKQRKKAEVLSEAADVGNFAMMVADVCGALPRRSDLDGQRREGQSEGEWSR